MQMAPKSKTLEKSSSAAATMTSIGGSPPQEAPILGKKVFRHCWTRRGSALLDSSWSWIVDADLIGPCLICKRDSYIDE